jgi:hypothetical protein
LAYACAGAGLHASRLPVFRDAVVTMRANLPIAILPESSLNSGASLSWFSVILVRNPPSDLS